MTPPPSENRLDHVREELIDVRANMKRIDSLIDKLDTTIDKLTSVSQSVSEILAVQTSRLQSAEQTITENRLRLVQIEKELHLDISDNKGEFLVTMKEFKEEVNKRLEKMDEKLEFVERWMWWVSGAAAVVGAFITKVSEKFI